MEVFPITYICALLQIHIPLTLRKQMSSTLIAQPPSKFSQHRSIWLRQMPWKTIIFIIFCYFTRMFSSLHSYLLVFLLLSLSSQSSSCYFKPVPCNSYYKHQYAPIKEPSFIFRFSNRNAQPICCEHKFKRHYWLMESLGVRKWAKRQYYQIPQHKWQWQ